MSGISLDTPDVQDPISLEGAWNTSPTLSFPVVSSRASKAEYALAGLTDHTYDDIHQAILGGREKEFRQDAAAKVDANKRLQYITGQIPPSEVLTRSNPDTVVEHNYGKKFVSSVIAPNEFNAGTPMGDAMEEVPEHVVKATDAGSSMVAKRELLLKYAQEMEEAAKKEPWGQWTVEKLTGIIPGYSQLITRGNIPTDTFHLLPGEDIFEQSKALYRTPLDEIPALLDKIKDGLGQNYPNIAAEFFRNLAGMSTDERILNNEIGISDMAAGVGMGASVIRKLALVNHARSAVKDMVRSDGKWLKDTTTVDPELVWGDEGGNSVAETIKAESLAASGNVHEAAVVKASDNIVKDLQGKSSSQKRAYDDLLSEHKVDLDMMKRDARDDEQELVTRIEQAYHDQDEDVIKALSSFRVNRTPIVETAPDVVRAVENKIKERWRGVDNQIMDIDTTYDQLTNTYSHEMKLGTHDGVPFQGEDVARENAKLNGLVIKPKETKPWQIKAYEAKIAAIDKKLKSPDIKPWAKKGLEAQRSALIDKMKPTEGYEIVKKGNGAYILYTRPVDERLINELSANPPKTKNGKVSIWKMLTTSAEDRNLAREQTPYLREQGVLNQIRAVLGWFRTPDETLAREVREQLKVATHAVTAVRSPAVKTFKTVDRLKFKPGQWNDLNRILKLAQKMPDPENGGVPGYFFKTVSEVKDVYQRHLNRLPSDQEVEAYFAYKRNQDYDLYLRRIASYIPKARVGGEQHRFSIKGPDGKPIKSNWFEGITRDGLPGGQYDNILVADSGELYAAQAIPSKISKGLKESIKSGHYKVIEAIDPDVLPFKNLSDKAGTNRIRYVVVSASETKPLSLIDQVPRRGGGHLTPDYKHVLKQAQINHTRVGKAAQDHYVGDATGMFFSDRVTGREITDKFNAVRQVWHEKGVKEARAEHARQQLPVDWKEFSSWFKESRSPGGDKIPPRFSTKEPFHLLGMDQNIGDIDKDGLNARYPKTFVDGTSSGSIARTFKVEFTGARDAHELKTINDVGSRAKPIYRYEDAGLVDPITAQNRGLSRIINSTMMNDVKLVAMNRWLHDAQPYLAADASEIWKSPYKYFNNPKFFDTTPKQTLNILKSNRMKLQNFMGTPNKVDTWLHEVAQDMADNIHGMAGPRLVPHWALDKVKDPTTAIRSFTSHMILGLGSVKQFFTQWTTHTNIFGMSPRSAPAGSMATLLHSWAAINSNPEVLAKMDSLASNMRMPGFHSFKPGQFTEAYDLLSRSGFITVAEEHALMNNLPGAAKLVKSGGQTILDWGLTPFKLGAESVRASAGYTAYLEWRAENPVGRMTRADEHKWLDRATLLDHNMSRASNSILHSGVMSVPGQFFAYDLRLAELMWGKRLAPLDKARLFAASAIMYGIPLGGLGLSGIPVYKYIRKQMESEHGYVVGDNFVTSVLMEGLPSAIGASITSHAGWNPKYGNWYDFSKFGAKGADYLDDLNSDVTWWKLVGGASASVFASAFKNTSNFRAAIMPHMMGGQDGFKFRLEDMTDAMKTASSYDQAWKFKHALNTGKWISNNENVIDESVSAWDAGFMALTGTQHVEYLDAYLKQQQMKEQEAFEFSILNQFRQNFDRYCQAAEQDGPDSQQAKDYKTRAFAILQGPGGFPENMLPQAIASACKGNEPAIKAIDHKFYTGKQVPTDEREKMLDAWKRTIQRQEGMGK